MPATVSHITRTFPFGEEMAAQHAGGAYATRYKFNGKELDPQTGYYYYGARYYDPVVSRWLSIDPLAEKYPGLSPYNYTANNPVMLVDPDGKWVKKGNNFNTFSLFDKFQNNRLFFSNCCDGNPPYVSYGGMYYYFGDDTAVGDNVSNVLPEVTITLRKNPHVIRPAPINNQNTSISQKDDFLENYLKTLSIEYSLVGQYGAYRFKSGKYVQTNGIYGNFHAKRFKKLSRNAKSEYIFTKRLSKVGRLGSAIQWFSIGLDVYEDGKIKTSNAVNGGLILISIAFPAVGTAVLIYSVADYIFDISGAIDNKFGQIKLYEKDD